MRERERSSSPKAGNGASSTKCTLPTYGAYALLGMLVILILFYLVRGKVRLESGLFWQNDRAFWRFSRFVHWLTAVCFILLALSGLNVVFGKTLLAPLIGESAFAATSQWAKICS